MTDFKIIKGDITKMHCDAIVNAANTSLLGGGGVDGAIHKACGSNLLNECRELKGCLTGHSKITKSYELEYNDVYWIIHTVGPIYRNNGSEEKYLRNSYNSVLTLAANYASVYKKQCLDIINRSPYKFDLNGFLGTKKRESLNNEIDDYINEHPIKSLAFPSISTGAYGYPLDDAAAIALNEITTFIDKNPDTFDEITMVCFDDRTYDTFKKLYDSDK